MKSILLYANADAGLESRLRAALDLARAFDGHLTCLQVTPYDAFVMGDPFGGVYALPTIIDQMKRTAEAHRTTVEQRLRGEGVSWDWLAFDGAPAQIIVDRSRLADLIVLSRPCDDPPVPNQAIVADVLVHARPPVLAVPPDGSRFDPLGTAMVAWDGSHESSHALRLTLPMLARAAAVHVVTISPGHCEFPAADAIDYLARHGIEAQPREWPAVDKSIADALVDAAAALGAAIIVMGAYGHTRLREAVLGGATRDMLHRSAIPLLLAH